jgi:polar amino acid transport system substrate-binding protein
MLDNMHKWLYNGFTSKNGGNTNTTKRRFPKMKKILSLVLTAALLCCSLLALASCNTADADVVKVIDINLSEEEYAFCVNKSDETLKTSVNAFLEKIQTNGKFDEICNNYFGDGTPLKITSATEDSSKDQLVVATSTGFEPFEMVDQNGKYSGIDLEIAYYLAEELGKELVIKDMQFEAVVTSVEQGICDIGMAGLSVTPARQEVVNFSDSYYNASQVLIVKADDTTFDECKTVADVVAILEALTAETKIGCQKGTTGEIYIDGDADQEDGYGFTGLNATKQAYDYAALAVTAMVNGTIDYVIVDNGPAKAIAASMNE